MSVRRFLDKPSYKRCTEVQDGEPQEIREPAVASALRFKTLMDAPHCEVSVPERPAKLAQDFNSSRYEIQGTRCQSSRKTKPGIPVSRDRVTACRRPFLAFVYLKSNIGLPPFFGGKRRRFRSSCPAKYVQAAAWFKATSKGQASKGDSMRGLQQNMVFIILI